jgi:RimJ/RimL family protein N-acetyltransferase
VLTLNTVRLTLRAWEEGDADFAFDLYSRWEVQRFIGAVPQVMEGRHLAVERIGVWRNIQYPVHAVWAVQLMATGLLGMR